MYVYTEIIRIFAKKIFSWQHFGRISTFSAWVRMA